MIVKEGAKKFKKAGENMLRISIQFFWQRRKRLAILMSVLVLSLALLLSMGPMFDAAEQKLYDTYTARYGGHHGAILHLDEQKMQILETYDAAEKAFFQNYGSWQQVEKGTHLTLGWFSEEAIAMGNLRLLEGRFAEAEDEIVLEKNAVKYFCPQGTVVGDTLTFAQDGTERRFRLVGILADYVGNWDTVMSTDVVAGYNDFPKGLLAKQSMLQTHTGALLYYPHVEPTQILMEIGALSEELHGLYSSSYISNEQLCYAPEVGIFQAFSAFKGMLTVAILIGAVLIMFVVMGMYIGEFKKSYHTLYLLGSGNRGAGMLYGLQCGWILLLAAPMALLTAQLWAWGYTLITGTALTVLYGENLLYPALMWAVLAAFMGVAFRAYVMPLDRKSLSQVKRGKGVKQIQYGRSVTGMLTGSFMQANFRRIVAVLCVIAVLIASFGIAGIYQRQFQENQEFREADFIVEAASISWMGAEGFDLSNYKDNLLRVESVLPLYTVKGVDFIDAKIYPDASIVIPGRNSTYWGRLKAYYGIEVQLPHIEDLPRSNVTVVSGEAINFEVKIISESMEADYLAAYPDLPLTQMKDEGSVALILAPVDGVKNDGLLQEGGKISFGRITYPQTMMMDEVVDNPEVIGYTQLDFPIAYICEEKRDTGIDKNYFMYPTILLTEQTALSTDLVQGYGNLMIYLQEDISEAEYAGIEQMLGEIAAQVSGATIYSLREDRAQNMALMDVVNLSLNLILGVFGVFAVIAIYSALYLNVMQRKRSFGIYRALGMRRRTISAAMLLELMVYWVGAVLAALAIGLLVFHFVWHIDNFFVVGQGLPLLYTVAIALAAGLPFNGLITHMLLREIYNDSVYTAMRFSE